MDAAVINTNFAMQVNLVPTKDALFMEDKTSPYVNIVDVRAGCLDLHAKSERSAASRVSAATR